MSCLALLLAALPVQYSEPAVLPGDTAPAPAAGLQDNADMAAGGPGYLAVWEDGRSALSGTVSPGGVSNPTDIYAVRLDASGRLLDAAPIIVTQQAFAQGSPRVAWNGSAWLVVWRGYSLTAFYFTQGVYAARISASGQLLDTTPILIDDDDSADEQPWDVAGDGTNWAVTWQDVSASGGWLLSGCQVDAAGTVFNKKSILSFSVGTGGAWNARLEWSANRYLLVWEQFASSNDIKGKLLDAALNAVGATFTITSNAWDQDRPSVAGNGAGFYVAWADEQLSGKVYGTPVTSTGTVVIPGGANLAGGQFPIDPSPAAAWNGSNWAVLWEDWSYPAGYSLYATQVDAAGGVMGSPILFVAPGATVTSPEAANGSGGILGVWTDHRNAQSSFGDPRDLFAGALTASGQVGPQSCVTSNAPAQTHPDFAGDMNGCLAVFLSRSSAEMKVMAQRLDFFGRPVDAQPAVLAAGPNTLGAPAVAWNGTLYLVVWEELIPNSFPAGQARVKGRRVQPDGTLLDPVPLDILPGNSPDVAALGDAFLVIASDEPVDHVRWIKGARVQGSSGVVLDPAPRTISASYAVAAAAGAFADRWIVLWQQHLTHDSPYSSVNAAFVDAAGAPGAQFMACNSSSSDRAPAVAVEGAQALFTWNDRSDVRSRFLRSDGVLLGAASGQLLSSAPNAQFASAVAWSGTQYLAGWSDWRLQGNLVEPGIGDTYSTRVRPDGSVTDQGGLAFSADPAGVEGNFTVAGARGTFVAGCAVLRGDSGNHRIVVRNLGPVLTQTELRRGQPATFSVAGGEPGDVAVFLYSLAGAGSGPAAAQLGGLRLDLLPPITVMGQVVTNASGGASLTLPIPPGAPLITVHTQAALRRGPAGAGSGKTNTVSAPIRP